MSLELVFCDLIGVIFLESLWIRLRICLRMCICLWMRLRICLRVRVVGWRVEVELCVF